MRERRRIVAHSKFHVRAIGVQSRVSVDARSPVGEQLAASSATRSYLIDASHPLVGRLYADGQQFVDHAVHFRLFFLARSE